MSEDPDPSSGHGAKNIGQPVAQTVADHNSRAMASRRLVWLRSTTRQRASGVAHGNGAVPQAVAECSWPRSGRCWPRLNDPRARPAAVWSHPGRSGRRVLHLAEVGTGRAPLLGWRTPAGDRLAQESWAWRGSRTAHVQSRDNEMLPRGHEGVGDPTHQILRCESPDLCRCNVNACEGNMPHAC